MTLTCQPSHVKKLELAGRRARCADCADGRPDSPAQVVTNLVATPQVPDPGDVVLRVHAQRRPTTCHSAVSFSDSGIGRARAQASTSALRQVDGSTTRPTAAPASDSRFRRVVRCSADASGWRASLAMQHVHLHGRFALQAATHQTPRPRLAPEPSRNCRYWSWRHGVNARYGRRLDGHDPCSSPMGPRLGAALRGRQLAGRLLLVVLAPDAGHGRILGRGRDQTDPAWLRPSHDLTPLDSVRRRRCEPSASRHTHLAYQSEDDLDAILAVLAFRPITPCSSRSHSTRCVNPSHAAHVAPRKRVNLRGLARARKRGPSS